MSVENVKAFIAEVHSDEALREEFKAIETEDRDAAIAQIVTKASEAGHTFTAEHYETAVELHIEALHAAGELSDADLEQVSAGGGDCSRTWCEMATHKPLTYC